jgi:hypothetical protein
MAENKKKKTTKKKATAKKKAVKKKTTEKKKAKRKRPVAKKTPTKRRRSSSLKKQTKRSAAKSVRKGKAEEEFAIPIHMVEPSDDDAHVKDLSDSKSLQGQVQDNEDLPEYDFSSEKEQKNVSGLGKREEHIMKKEEDVELDLKKKSKKSKAGKTILIVLGFILGILAITAVVYALLISRQSSFTGDANAFTVSAPAEVLSGGEVEYTIQLQNNEQVAFEDISFDIVYPEGFTVTSVNPRAANFNQTKWEVDSLLPGSSVEIEIAGVIIGAQNESKELASIVSYRPENVSSPFVEEKSALTLINALDTEISVQGPDSVTSGEEFSFETVVENTTSADLDNLRVRLTYPEGFDFKSAQPRPDFGIESFDIGLLEDGDSSSVEVKGVLTGKVNDKKTILVELGFVTESNEFISQIQQEYDIEIGEVLANIETTVGGEKESSAALGELLEFEVEYRNEGTESFINAAIETKIDTSLIDTDSIEVDRGRFENSVVVWDAESVDEFESIAPGDEGVLTFKARIKEQVDINDKSDKNYEISAASVFTSDGVEGDEERDVAIEGNTALIKIDTDMDVAVEAHYYDFEGNKVGSGPLPPVKNQETQYRVYFSISNTVNEVDDVTVVLKAGENVSFTGVKSTEVGALSVNSKTLTWNVGKVPAHTGRFLQNIEAYADIIFQPTDDQVGVAPELFSTSSISGQDVFSLSVLEPEVELPTTNLEDDPFANEGGVVQSSTSSSTSLQDDAESEPFIDPDSSNEADSLR